MTDVRQAPNYSSHSGPARGTRSINELSKLSRLGENNVENGATDFETCFLHAINNVPLQVFVPILVHNAPLGEPLGGTRGASAEKGKCKVARK